MFLFRRTILAAAIASLAMSPLAVATALAETVTMDDVYEVPEDQVLVVPSGDLLGVLANDTSSDGALCMTEVVGDSLEGAIEEIGEDGSFTYTPPADFNGTTAFGYSVAIVDGGGACPDEVVDGATVTITVTPVNDAPTARGDSFSALADRTLNVNAPGVLGNDHDIDGDPLTAVKVSNPGHGVVTLAADGGFSYTPNSGFVGKDVFSYQASDGSTMSPTRVVSISVSALPTPVPTLAPTPTAAPTPTPEITPEPSPTESVEPSPSAVAIATGAPSLAPSPTASPTTSPAASGGLSLPVLVVGLLLLSLVAFGAAVALPKWLERQRADTAGDDFDEGPPGTA